MNILKALVQLRDDLQAWVTVNLNALNSKIDENTVPIDNELNAESANPVQNKVINEKIEELNGLIGNESVANQISTAIANQERFSGDYSDLINAPNIVEDESGNMIIADEAGNTIFKVDADGIHSTALTLNGEDINNLLTSKVDKEEGKGLSSNDYTDADKAKLALISSDIASASIDSALSTTSDNPVKNKVIATEINSLKTLVGTEPVANQISDAVSRVNGFSGDYADLTNAPNITENDSDSVVFSDDKGFVVAKVDKDGIHTNGLILNGENVLNRINTKFSEITETMENYDRLRTGLIPMGTKIEADTELNSIAMIKVGSYYCTPNTTVATLINCPTLHAFIMQVYSPISTKIDNEEIDAWVYRVRKILDYEGNEYTQVVYSNATAGEFYFKNWEQVAKTGYIDDKLSSKLDKSPYSIELNANGGLNNYGGFIDFHYHDANGAETGNTDYSSRIIEGSQGIISINNVDFNIADASMQAATIRVKAQQAISDSVVRNSKLVTTETNPTVNGEICWVYE